MCPWHFGRAFFGVLWEDGIRDFKQWLRKIFLRGK